MRYYAIVYLLLMSTIPLYGVSKAREKTKAQQPAITLAQKDIKSAPVPEESPLVPPPTAQLADGIAAVIYTTEGFDVITRSELERLGLDGRQRTFEDIKLEKLMYQDAIKYHLIPTDEEVQSTIKSVQRENNLSQEQLEQLFIASGYPYEEGIAQFKTLTAVNNAMGFRVGANLIVPEKDIIAYHESHPEIEEAAYFIRRGVVARAPIESVEKQKARIKAELATGKDPVGIQWGEPFWLNDSELVADKRFIAALAQNEYSEPMLVRNGFEIYQMIERKEERMRTLEERYREIADILKRPRQQELMEEYKKELESRSVIEVLDQEK